MKDKYNDELEFENDLVTLLTKQKGWKDGVLKYPTENELISNWANILYQNNRSTDRLGNYPLTRTEMQQIISQISHLRTPLKLNGFINGKVISIIRDNPDDKEHLGKTVSLKIYDRNEIAGGESTYQIAEQPIFSKKSNYLPNRRGDVMLLINGMPVIHIELKRSGIPISQAQYQIQKYSEEGLFAGIYSLIQVFVAMTPEEMTYFANPGPDGKFNKRFFFHWEDFNNEIVSDWRLVSDQFLSIPMAHQLVGFYTIADDNDGILKVMRSYQYYAANAISDIVSKVSKNGWKYKKSMRGGYIWHTTGSGKTLTSFKAAQLIANSRDADKVVFLMDRVELGTQSLQEYKGFADDFVEIQGTESTDVLRNKLKSSNLNDTLIVTSIQKMSRLSFDDPYTKDDIEKIRLKRLVIIIDECHRSVFGEMLEHIQDTFPNGLMFGFTGTPIQLENQKKENTTSSIFGNELHRYSISDGIRDKNVLGFDTFKIETFDSYKLRQQVALHKANAKNVYEACNNEIKKNVYYHYMNDVPMATLGNGESIESNINKVQYNDEKHRKIVCKNILEKWVDVSRDFKYHAILATSSISEACEYYKLFKDLISDESNGYPKLKITALFDPHTDNDGNDIVKEEAIIQILKDYDQMYGTTFTDYSLFKKDVSNRLAHKKPYRNISHKEGTTLDLLIVVNQMLTGFDSARINALHVDKVLEYEGIVQAFSRTNRLNDSDKPHGLIYYYRYPNTMELNIKEAFRLYSGDKTFGIFVDKLNLNLKKLNLIFEEIKQIFESNKIVNFSKNPANSTDKAKFALNFNKFNTILQSAKVQGFRRNKLRYEFNQDNNNVTIIDVAFTLEIYNILKQRYIELFKDEPVEPKAPPIFYDLDPTLIMSSSDRIDYDYLNLNFKKYVKEIQLYGANNGDVINLLNNLRMSFSNLSQDDQKIANILINDIQMGNIIVKEDDNFIDLINNFKITKREQSIRKFCDLWHIDIKKFNKFIEEFNSLKKINQYGNLDKLIESVDISLVAKMLEKKNGKKVPLFIASRELQKAITNFLANDCLEE